MQRTSVIGWIPKDERESETIEMMGLSKTDIKNAIEMALYKTKKEAMMDEAMMDYETDDVERVRVTVTVDVEKM